LEVKIIDCLLRKSDKVAPQLCELGGIKVAPEKGSENVFNLPARAAAAHFKYIG